MTKLLLQAMITVVAVLPLIQCSSPTPQTVPLSLAVSGQSKAGAKGSAVFTLKAKSVAAIRELRLLVNAEIDGRNACYIYYLRESNSFALVNDSGAGSKVLPVGTPDRIENSQCAIDGGQSSVQAGEGGVQVTIAVEFRPAFAGKKQLFGYAEDSAGANTGIRKQRDWAVF